MAMRKTSIPQAIREAIDSYPEGLCFSMPDGRPVLVNRRMNELIVALTGHTVLDAEAVWEELGGLSPANGCAALEKPWPDAPGGDGGGSQLAFSFPDGSVWRFRRTPLKDAERGYVQLEAAEITELYRLSEKLSENNVRLKDLQERQKNLLRNIVQINREKELLAVKMRVHDEFGRCLVATRKALAEEALPRETAEIAKAWEDAIRDLSNIPLDEPAQDVSPEAELLQVAEMVGCRILFLGERPADRGALLLLYAAVREALTNAVRHAHADQLMVFIRRSSFGYHVEISDNGGVSPGSVREGGGLSNLRRRLEREGASLQIRCGNGVSLILELPSDEKRSAQTGGENP